MCAQHLAPPGSGSPSALAAGPWRLTRDGLTRIAPDRVEAYQLQLQGWQLDPVPVVDGEPYQPKHRAPDPESQPQPEPEPEPELETESQPDGEN